MSSRVFQYYNLADSIGIPVTVDKDNPHKVTGDGTIRVYTELLDFKVPVAIVNSNLSDRSPYEGLATVKGPGELCFIVVFDGATRGVIRLIAFGHKSPETIDLGPPSTPHTYDTLKTLLRPSTAFYGRRKNGGKWTGKAAQEPDTSLAENLDIGGQQPSDGRDREGPEAPEAGHPPAQIHPVQAGRSDPASSQE